MTQMRRIATDTAPKAIGPYNQAVVAGGLVHCSGQIAFDPKGGDRFDQDVASQTERVFENLSAVLQASGTSLARVLKCTVYLLDMKDFTAMNEVYGRYFAEGQAPARSTVAVAGLPRGAKVEIDCVALAD
jgi:2-iminobutanoate/2-iminopropanoate deaminase